MEKKFGSLARCITTTVAMPVRFLNLVVPLAKATDTAHNRYQRHMPQGLAPVSPLIGIAFDGAT